MKKERYRIYEYGKHIGYFNVEYDSLGERKYSADLFADSESFVLRPDKNGHITHEKIKMWIAERVVPKNRIGINELLHKMGLSEYDELCILKYTSARHTSDTCFIDFKRQV